MFRANRQQSELKLRSTQTNSKMPAPSSVKNMVSENYLDNYQRKIDEENKLNYSGSRVA